MFPIERQVIERTTNWLQPMYIPIMIIAANRSSISLSGFWRARNSASPCPSRFFNTLFVSDTTAAALNTARSWAIWYSGRAWEWQTNAYYTVENYNIANRATQSNSVYVSVLQISTVLADGVSKSLCQNFFSRERPLSARGKILYFATMMDTETRPTSPKTNTIFRPFLVG